MLTRRSVNVGGLSLAAGAFSGIARGQEYDKVTVRIRADETVRDVLSPIELVTLKVEPDHSEVAKEFAAKVPPGRAAPIILIIVGAIAVTELLRMIKELYRQTYYGGVLIDVRTKPPTITSDLKLPANLVLVIDSNGEPSGYMAEDFGVAALKIALGIKK